jgi:HEAT repeat protein
MLAIWEAIEGMGEKAVPKLSEMLKDENEDVREFATAALKHIGAPETLVIDEEEERYRRESSYYPPLR